MPDEKKIIIDEDWKSRVEAEKAEAEARKEAQESTGEGAGAAAAGQGPMQMPPASFEMLLSTLATEAMVALGQIPHPATGQAEPNLEQAKYFIDTVEVLQEKTKGNLTPAESQATEDVIHQLRMVFVAIQQQGRGPTAAP